MSRHEEEETRAQIRGRLAAEGAARALQWLAALAAGLAFLWKGIPAGLVLAALAGLFYLARPGPCPDIDRKLGR